MLNVIRNPCLRRCACALVLLAGASAGGARAAENPATPPAQPTRVAASFSFITIDDVDSVNETFNADFYLRLGWDDPRLEGLSPDQIDSGAIWRPTVEVTNSRDVQQPWEPYCQFPGPGKAVLLSRLHGTFAAPMDLHDFPFDHQVLPIEIEALGLTADQMVFGYPGDRHEERDWTAPLKPKEVLGTSVQLPEWEIEAVQVHGYDNYYRFVGGTYARYRIELLVSRQSGFYVWKIIAIEAMIVVLSWIAFLLDAGEVGNRSAVSITLLLATVAFSYVVGEITPRISYLTRLDWFLLGCFVLIFLSALETVAVYVLQRRGKRAAVPARIDRWSLAGFPLLFLLLNLLIWAPTLA